MLSLDMLSRSNFTKGEGVEITSSPIVTKVPKASAHMVKVAHYCKIRQTGKSIKRLLSICQKISITEKLLAV